jgi:hypothetical protein
MLNKESLTNEQPSPSSTAPQFDIENIEEIILTPKVTAKKQSDNPQQKQQDEHDEKFDTPEHIDIGNTAFMQFIDSNKDLASLLGLKIERDHSNNDKITNIQILLENQTWLAPGDFFGKPKQPICFGENIENQKQRFNKAYATLLKTKYSDQIAEVLKYAKEQHDKRHGGNGPSIFKHGFDKMYVMNREQVEDNSDNGLVSNLKYSFKTREPNKPWESRYAKLSLTNFDHFGKEAKRAFRAGYLVAIDTAKEAAQATDDETKAQLLRKAMTQMLFACHYLTDLYAAGHIRTPRKAILNSLVNKPINEIPAVENISTIRLMTAGFLAKEMHDEDCAKSINVTINREKWLASGDGTFYKNEYEDNARKVCNAMVAALKEVIKAYNNGESYEPKYEDFALNNIPEDNTGLNEKRRKPMFKVMKGETSNQEEVHFRKDGTYEKMQLTSTFCHFFSTSVKTKTQEIIEVAEDQVEQFIEEVEKLRDGLSDMCKIS